jgi:hypothetical protein
MLDACDSGCVKQINPHQASSNQQQPTTHNPQPTANSQQPKLEKEIFYQWM